MNKPLLTDELLARYLASSATRQEIEEVEAWLASSPDHRDELRAYRKLWERSRSAGKQLATPDTDAAWKKVQAKMHTSTDPEARTSATTEIRASGSYAQPKRFPFAYMAAAIVTLALLTWGWLYFSRNQETTLISLSTQNNTYEKTLPDGTKVFLNYNSTLTYPDQLEGDIRAVTLRGEAFFDVKPDASHPFVIDANGTEIRVLGTSFNVKAYQEEVKVEVKTGKVEVRKSDQRVQLLPGEGVVVVDTVFRSIQASQNATAYQTKVFNFTATSLLEVVNTLNQGYHADVRLSGEQLADCRLTAHYEQETFDNALQLIAETMNLTVRKEGSTYWLEGKGCQ